MIKYTKLVKALEKIGFAHDSYLGNLTVSPVNLGTSLKLSGRLDPIHSLTSELTKQIEDQNRVKITIDRGFVHLESHPILAPKYNETSQFLDFFTAASILSQME
jgi:protein-arginine kinase